MGRAKIDMKFIAKEKTRNTTYEKRKLGMLKKADEFKKLCAVDTAVIIYPPNSNTPEIWPKSPEKIKKSIDFYKAKEENGKRVFGLKDYFEDRKKTVENQLVKARKRNLEAKYATWFEELDGLSEGQLRHFAMGLEKKENAVRELLELQKRKRFEPVNYHHQYAAGSSHQLPAGLDQVQMVNLNHNLMNNGLGWLDGAPTTSFVPTKSNQVGGYGYSYPLFGGGMVYGNSNPWLMFQPPAVQGGVMPELVMQDFNSQVNNGVGGFVMDHYGARYLG